MFHPRPDQDQKKKTNQRKQALVPSYASFLSAPAGYSSDEIEDDAVIKLLLADDKKLNNLHKRWQDLKAQKAKFILEDYVQKNMQAKFATLDAEVEKAKREYWSERQTAIAALFDYGIAYDRQFEYYQSVGLDDEDVARSMRSFPNPTVFSIQANKRLILAYVKTIEHPQAANLARLLSNETITDPNWSDLSLFIKDPLPKQCFELSMSISGSLAYSMNELADKRSNPWLKFALKSGKILIGAIQAHPLIRIGGIIIFEAADSWSPDLDAKQMMDLEQRLDQALKIQRQIIPRICGINECDLLAMYEALNLPLLAMFNDSTTPYKIQRLLELKISNNEAERDRQLNAIKAMRRKLTNTV